jgi:glycine betaine/proline transport system ATP-binding protein
MTETAEPLAPTQHRIDRTSTPVIRAEGIWKVFGPNPDRLVGSEDAYLPRGELREKTGCVVAVRDVSFEVRR